MRTRTDALLLVAAHELRGAARSRMLLGFALLFTMLCLGIALAGLAGTGQLLVQGFTRTGVSLLGIAVYLLPLMGAILGASAFGGEDGGLELVLAQPIGRGRVLLGRTLGLAAALGVAAMAGFGSAGVLVAVRAGMAGLGGYLVVAGGTLAAGLAGLSLGVMLGIVARRRGAAVGWALTLWFAAAVLYDLAAIAALQLLGSGDPSGWLVSILALNPMDGVRAMGLIVLGADVLLGPTGAALRTMMGMWGGGGWVAASLAGWIVLPLALTVALYRRRDF